MAAGKEFGACFFADGDGILAGCSFDEVCDEGFPTGTEFDVFGGARTGYCLRILLVTSFLAGMDSTVKFPVVSPYLKGWSTFHTLPHTDRTPTMTLTLRHFESRLFLETSCRNNESLSNVSHSNMKPFP